MLLRHGVTPSHRNEDTPDIDFVFFGQEPLLAVLPASHPLAGRRKLALQLLSEEPFVFWRRSIRARLP
jgi:DNA-binding transcriptional LysR family regulator